MKKAQNTNIKILNEILYEILENKVFLNEALNLMEIKYSYLPMSDRHFIRRVVKGVLEKKLTIDFYIDSISKVKVKQQKKWVRTILRSSIYQIKYMDKVKDYAVVSESVNLIKTLKYPQFSGFLNGVLRNYIRKANNLIPLDLETKYSVPKWIIDKFISEEGEDKAIKILSSIDKDIYPITIRLNTLTYNKEDIIKDLKDEGYVLEEISKDYNVYSLSNINSLSNSKSFLEGKFYIQDLSSMYPAFLSDVKPTDRLLDACASPGGKSILFKELFLTEGYVLSCDITDKKVSKIRENVLKSNLSNIDIRKMDATVFYKELKSKFDVVLADVPCSGLGLLKRKADIRYRLKPKDIENLSHLQKKIIDNVISYLKKDGTFIYSTCTISKPENEDNTLYILNKYKNLYLYKEKKILPFMYGSDGFYTAIFKTKAEK